MVREELVRRLNDREYINWLKAGRCLLILKNGLHRFISQHMKSFHADLLNQNTVLRKQCVTSCRPRGNKLSGTCMVCAEWQRVIIKHHRQPDATMNWDNCFPPAWRTDHWEVAKAYMPRGQGKVKGADQFDASALLNLINYCDCFQSVNPKLVREVIRYRNELMHSCEMHMKDEWMRCYQITLRRFVQQFSHVPQMTTAGQEINEVSVCVCVCACVCVCVLLSELLQERLQELLYASDAADDAATKTQVRGTNKDFHLHE
uniref:Uncharacterized protein n=1 Tax=Seriola lalandi dorsalis TaxID=1841481 RepID=A0A3B4WN24_SERLL